MAPANAPLPSAAGNTRAMRDELVRAVMPELRTLVEHLVKTTVERSMGPLLDRVASAERTSAPSDERRELEAAIELAVAPFVAKQRELEAALGELRRAPAPPQALPNTPAQRAPQGAALPARAAVAAAPLPARPAPIAPADDANAAWELPAALNGSRRKRMVIWLLALSVALGLLTVVVLAVLSNTGRYL